MINQTKTYPSLSHSQIILHSQHQQSLNDPTMNTVYGERKSLAHSNAKSCAQKNHSQSHHIQKPLANSNISLENPKNQRSLLIEKRKSYADSIRSKNKAQIQSNNIKNSNKKLNTSLHSNTNIIESKSHLYSPPKKETQNLTQLEKQYYETLKLIDKNAFKEIIPKNTNHSNMFKTSQNTDDFLSKIKDKINHNNHNQNNKENALTKNQLLSYRESYSSRKKTQNKQNNNPALSTERKSFSKNTSYAQIFDKKNTLNSILTHQRGKNVSSNHKNHASKKKEEFSLSSIASPPQQLFGRNSENSDFLDNFQCKVNGFMIQEFNDEIEEYMDKIEDVSNFQCNPSKKVEASQKNNSKQKLSLNFQVFEQKIDINKQQKQLRIEEEKQINLLRKQNGTFKRQLATFRKQNSQLRKQIDSHKKYIEQLEHKAKLLLEQQQQVSSLRKSEQQNLNNHLLSLSILQKNASKAQRQEDRNLVEILEQNEKQTYMLRQNNKALELRVFMLQKRIALEEESSRKKFAVQINSWRDRLNRLKNQNSKLKNALLSKSTWGSNLDSSISMEISRQESVLNE